MQNFLSLTIDYYWFGLVYLRKLKNQYYQLLIHYRIISISSVMCNFKLLTHEHKKLRISYNVI